jgi:hypothetical protein
MKEFVSLYRKLNPGFEERKNEIAWGEISVQWIEGKKVKQFHEFGKTDRSVEQEDLFSV